LLHLDDKLHVVLLQLLHRLPKLRAQHTRLPLHNGLEPLHHILKHALLVALQLVALRPASHRNCIDVNVPRP
jgi:hypothetical protein